MSKVNDKLKEILKTLVDDEKFVQVINDNNEMDFIKDLEFDSLDIMNLIIEIQDEFQIDISEEDNLIDIINDFSKLCLFLEQRRK